MSSAGGPLPAAPGNELERIKGVVGRYFPVYETRIAPMSLVLLVHADPSTLEARFDELRQELWPLLYIPQIRREQGEYVIEVVRRPAQSPWGPVVNLALLLATVVSTIFAGAFLWVAFRGGSTLTLPDLANGALYFAAPLMAILGLHELGHFWMARRHKVDASLPYFLPVPPPILIFGTFGAFISLREPFPDKKALLDIGAAGPIVGFLVAIPVTLLGLHLSASAPALSLTVCGPSFLGFSYGNLVIETPAVWMLFSLLIPGATPNLHPLALAGWVGILVTAFNLLPAGQLDGGHVARALLGKRATWASYASLLVLVVLFVFTGYFGWLLFALFVFFIGMRHPPPLNDISPLGGRRIAVGLLAVGILLAGFTAVPLATANGQFHLQDEATSQLRPLPPGLAMADNLSFALVNKDIVPHAYVVSASIDKVVTSVNGSTQELTGAQLSAFEANSTWRITSANGNVTTFAHAASFTQSSSAYTALNPSQAGLFTIEYANPAQATVTVTIVVTQLCPISSVSNANSWQTDVY